MQYVWLPFPRTCLRPLRLSCDLDARLAANVVYTRSHPLLAHLSDPTFDW